MATSSHLTATLSRISFLRRLASPSSVPLFLPPKQPQNHRWARLRVFSMASEPKESGANNPGLHTTPDEATKGYIMQQTMFRIKDPKVSLDFYSRVLGMSLLKRLDFPEMKFSLYFMGYEDLASVPNDPAERTAWTFAIGVLKVILNSKDTTTETQNLGALDTLGLLWMTRTRHVRDLKALVWSL
ncbi:hypothetical protein Tsubulata_007497 [Turnera subulata]|uniref:Glyoxalase/fosfomycin resistance/dioxygenase domain-containing protein n=1 Tax=Turnera subulata TaxID=218843 RepID=A0A9Q0FE30_9ROSI|nr:hypothetical protein Tsubulata_007497 [Turnera subulata]